MNFTKREQQALYYLLTLQQYIGSLPSFEDKLILDHIHPAILASLEAKKCFESDLGMNRQFLTMLGMENAIPHHALLRNRFTIPFSESEWAKLMRGFPNEQCLIAWIREQAIENSEKTYQVRGGVEVETEIEIEEMK